MMVKNQYLHKKLQITREKLDNQIPLCEINFPPPANSIAKGQN